MIWQPFVGGALSSALALYLGYEIKTKRFWLVWLACLLIYFLGVWRGRAELA